MELIFKNDLDFNTEYLITINGTATSTDGYKLVDTPYVLRFQTRKELFPPTITITKPKAGSNIEPDKKLTISGDSSGIAEGTNITVTLSGATENTVIASDGTWSVTIKTPHFEGEYIIGVLVDDYNYNMSSTLDVKQSDDSDGDSDNEGIFGLGMGESLAVILLLVIMVIVMILLFITKRKQARLTSELASTDDDETAHELDDEEDDDDKEDEESEE
jgi:hypothetical protein